mmetsp:Transcript_38805/g.106903  ORF Transcript_38805/g.106903 Transcript_38805/m.106903 type:complete len:146 (+) Transcript_38805:105-542(+)
MLELCILGISAYAIYTCATSRAGKHEQAPDDAPKVDSAMVSTTNEIIGTRIVRQLGVVRGVSVRSRGFGAQQAAAFQMLRGGNITILSRLAEETRAQAFDTMCYHAKQMGADAVVGVRYETAGVIEVLVYGTAVQVEPLVNATRS